MDAINVQTAKSPNLLPKFRSLATTAVAADCRCHQMWPHRVPKNKKQKTKQGKRGKREGGAVGLFPNNIGINDDNEEGKQQRPQNKTRMAPKIHDSNTSAADQMKRVTDAAAEAEISERQRTKRIDGRLKIRSNEWSSEALFCPSLLYEAQREVNVAQASTDCIVSLEKVCAIDFLCSDCNGHRRRQQKCKAQFN